MTVPKKAHEVPYVRFRYYGFDALVPPVSIQAMLAELRELLPGWGFFASVNLAGHPVGISVGDMVPCEYVGQIEALCDKYGAESNFYE